MRTDHIDKTQHCFSPFPPSLFFLLATWLKPTSLKVAIVNTFNRTMGNFYYYYFFLFLELRKVFSLSCLNAEERGRDAFFLTFSSFFSAARCCQSGIRTFFPSTFELGYFKVEINVEEFGHVWNTRVFFNYLHLTVHRRCEFLLWTVEQILEDFTWYALKVDI